MTNSDDHTNPYHHGNLHQALLEAAVTELRNGSVEQLSLRALARHVGVSQAAPYRHFKDKDDLLAQLAIWSFDELTAALGEASSEQPDRPLRQRLRACGEAYIHYALAHPEKYRLMFGRFLPDRHLNPALHSSGERAFMVLVNLIRQGVDEGTLINHDPQLLAFHLWSSIHGLSSLLIDDFDQCHDGYNECERQQLIQSNLDLLGSGIIPAILP
ncbi:TetR/AcrR family transcriptional regulator [Parathalassolituus penaei]|uniref:TetR/AcrR family transcriptional regulator n=1 Tax=Parathalassolituus penaei TaxID=2997323 RepID=A0A9X3ECL1_9GAMM|nr:TetR/AcrR family transcriptional regulator [Parathalassolituus penaei]MCY0965114.1 TetR/AcrR family transcriptional regulator [Parathalassolituus penaei]